MSAFPIVTFFFTEVQSTCLPLQIDAIKYLQSQPLQNAAQQKIADLHQFHRGLRARDPKVFVTANEIVEFKATNQSKVLSETSI